MEPPAHPLRRFPWIGCGVSLFVVFVLVAIIIPGLLSSGRASNDRNAASSLKTLATAEADFRANDRDGNKVNDFWTADVKGLYTMTSAAVRGVSKEPWNSEDPPIKLIELSVAAADADDLVVPAGGENMPLSLFAVPSPKAGYWFAALDRDLSAPADEMTYKTDTGGETPMGKCHNTSKFGFTAFPDTMKSGPWIFIINEGNMIYRTAATTQVRMGQARPPKIRGFLSVYHDWPADAQLKSCWSKLD